MKMIGRIFEWSYDDIVCLPELDRDSMEKLRNYIENLGDSAFKQGYIDGLNAKESECNGCAFEGVNEWEMPCAKCKRGCKDYWREKA